MCVCFFRSSQTIKRDLCKKARAFFSVLQSSAESEFMDVELVQSTKNTATKLIQLALN